MPIHVNEVYIDENGKRAERTNTIKTDEGPRFGTSMEGLSKCDQFLMQKEP